MSLSPEQIGKVRQIARLRSFEETQNLCSKLNNVEEGQAIEYIAEWATVGRRFLKGEVDGIDLDKSDYRLAIINDMRRLLGLTELTSDKDSPFSGGEICYSHPEEYSEC